MRKPKRHTKSVQEDDITIKQNLWKGKETKVFGSPTSQSMSLSTELPGFPPSAHPQKDWIQNSPVTKQGSLNLDLCLYLGSHGGDRPLRQHLSVLYEGMLCSFLYLNILALHLGKLHLGTLKCSRCVSTSWWATVHFPSSKAQNKTQTKICGSKAVMLT